MLFPDQRHLHPDITTTCCAEYIANIEVWIPLKMSTIEIREVFEMKFASRLTMKDIENNHFVGIAIAKSDVEKCSFVNIEKTMKVLDMAGKKAKSKVMFSFDGYNDIPDEIYEIPAIRKWMNRFSEKYPHFLYYTTFDIADGPVALLGAIGDVESMWQGKPIFAPIYYDKYEDVPKKQIRITLAKEIKDQLIQGLKKYGEKVKDEKGATEKIQLLKIMTRTKS